MMGCARERLEPTFNGEDNQAVQIAPHRSLRSRACACASGSSLNHFIPDSVSRVWLAFKGFADWTGDDTALRNRRCPIGAAKKFRRKTSQISKNRTKKKTAPRASTRLQKL